MNLMEVEMKAMAVTMLEIDIEQALDRLNLYLQHLIQNRSKDGILLGLSGGIDSSVLAMITVEALGRQSVHLSYLYDQHSSPEQYHSAMMMSQLLGIEMKVRSIEAAMQELRVYSPFGMKITSFSGSFNRLLHRAYHGIFNETPFLSSLKMGHDEALGNSTERFDFRRIIRQSEIGMNMRHIYRRKVLEEQAHTQGWLLIGAANRTESQVGWFVKNGIDDLTIQPIKGLYKTQVRQLANHLHLPPGIITQLPSPDMVKGITDEFALGMSYTKIDLALDYLEGGLTMKEIVQAGCSEEDIHQVRELKQLSSWKRVTPDTDLPIDGGPLGGLRTKPS
jgi:NAD+ synthase